LEGISLFGEGEEFSKEFSSSILNLKDVGLSEMEALQAGKFNLQKKNENQFPGTCVPGEMLELKIGKIKPGYLVDIIACSKNPVEDISACSYKGNYNIMIKWTEHNSGGKIIIL
jgi:hypothetical protein